MGIVSKKGTERKVVLINNNTNNRFIAVTWYNSHKANERLQDNGLNQIRKKSMRLIY